MALFASYGFKFTVVTYKGGLACIVLVTAVGFLPVSIASPDAAFSQAAGWLWRQEVGSLRA